MIIDAHAHIFTSLIVENVAKKKEMAKKLCLETKEALDRIGVETLENSMKTANVEACLVLPTASVDNVKKVNNTFIEIASNSKMIRTAGTLHPDYSGNKEELARFKSIGMRAIKMCSFSQGFVLNGKKAIDLFDIIKNENRNNNNQYFIVLDTFYNADIFFGTEKRFNTTPELFGDIIKNYPEIKFVGAHMASLDAPFDKVRKYLLPRDNFYMDTSNADHTLTEDEFVYLLKTHGPEHIFFGTDWPWFGYKLEIDIVAKRLDKAGFTSEQKKDVFRNNIAKLLGIF